MDEIQEIIQAIRQTSDCEAYDRCVEGLTGNAKAFADLMVSNVWQINTPIPYDLIRKDALEIQESANVALGK